MADRNEIVGIVTWMFIGMAVGIGLLLALLVATSDSGTDW